VVEQDLRTENAAGPSRAPQPIVPRSPRPVATEGDRGDIEWPAALALMGALALGDGLLVAGRRFRTQTDVAG